MKESFGMDVEGQSKSGCAAWKIWLGCSLLIGAGLAIGLGVGLSKEEIVYVPITTTTDPPKTTSPSNPTTTTPDDTTTTPDDTTTGSVTVDPGDGPWKNYRLPSNVIPYHYALTLHPNMTTDRYTGLNAMSVNITQATSYIIVHIDENLSVTSVKLENVQSNGAATDVGIKRHFRYPEFEFYVIEADNNLSETTDNHYLLTMEFEGPLIGRIVGLYKAVYTDTDTGEEKAMVGSDMEPTDARKAYPCFDEPALKIRYTTTLVHESRHHALSNMNEVSVIDREDGLQETLFAESVPMSTYLGCFAISDFTYIEDFSSKNNISLRVYIPPHKFASGQANYSLEVMKVMFDFYENYFDMDYSLPKCDMISIPDFGTGAMENWGLITYREVNLLWDPVESSTTNKQRVAAVVAHELVHQWFGNVVTMKWWDNLWLNEGFASYLEYAGQNIAEPDWNINRQIAIGDIQRAMRADQSVTSHPVRVDVDSPSQITSVFDTLTYSKGAAVLSIMEDILGFEHFRGGIRRYLKNREFGVADEKELWADVQEYLDEQAVDIDIAAYMDPWINQMGFPVLNVASDTTVTQTHFLTDPNADLSIRPPSAYYYEWNVWIDWVSSDNVASNQIEGGNMTLEIGNTAGIQVHPTIEPNFWLKLNPKQPQYYRVDYDDTMWTTIADTLLNNLNAIDDTDRCNYLDDGFNLASAQLLEYTQALDLTRYLENESSYLVWYAFSYGSAYIRGMLQNTPIYQDFKDYYRVKVKPVADELGWDASVGTHEEKLNRPLVLGLALRYDDTDALANATDLFTQWIADSSFYLYPDTRQLVYRYGMAGSGETEWEEMVERYIVETVASERTNLLRGLTSTEDIKLIDRSLELCKNESVIKTQDFFTCVNYVSYTINGNKMAWIWIQANWEYMVARFGITSRSLGQLIPGVVEDYNTELQLWEVESFFARYPEAGAGESGRATAINNINTNIEWMAKNQEPILTWLTDNLP